MIDARCSPNKRMYNNFIQLLSNFIIIQPISNFTIPLKGQLHRTIFHLFIVNNFTNLFVPPLHGANTKLSKTLIIIIAKLFEPLPFEERGWHFANVAASYWPRFRLTLARSANRRTFDEDTGNITSQNRVLAENVWQRWTEIRFQVGIELSEAFSPVCVEIGLPKLQFLSCAIF